MSLLLNAACLAEKQWIPLYSTWFDLTQLEPTIYCTWGNHINHYSSNAVENIKTKSTIQRPIRNKNGNYEILNLQRESQGYIHSIKLLRKYIKYGPFTLWWIILFEFQSKGARNGHIQNLVPYLTKNGRQRPRNGKSLVEILAQDSGELNITSLWVLQEIYQNRIAVFPIPELSTHLI